MSCSACCEKLTGPRAGRPVLHRKNLLPSQQLSTKSKDVGSFIRAVARRSRPSTASVLISGASGSGKELVARAIQRTSARTEMLLPPSTAVSFPETILESELFGHEKGASPARDASRSGLFEGNQWWARFSWDETISGDQSELSSETASRFAGTQKVRRVGSTRSFRSMCGSVCSDKQGLGRHLIRQRQISLNTIVWRVTTQLPSLKSGRRHSGCSSQHFLERFNPRQQTQCKYSAKRRSECWVP